MSASAAALKECTKNYDSTSSFNKRAEPSQVIIYKHANLLYEAYNDKNMSQQWVTLFFNQNLMTRNQQVSF